MQSYHVQRLQSLGKFAVLNATGRVEVLAEWINPNTNKGTAISNQRLLELSQETLKHVLIRSPDPYVTLSPSRSYFHF